MELPTDILARDPEEAARRIALGLLHDARLAARRLDDPDDGTALHDFRVAVRRLRSTLRAWRGELRGSIGRRHRRALRTLQVATAAGRDAEVALEWLASIQDDLDPSHRGDVDWLRARLESRHRDALRAAGEGVRDAFKQARGEIEPRLRRWTRTIDEADDAPHVTFSVALADRTRLHAEELRRLLEGAGASREQAALHASRIAAKRLRYLLEPVRSGRPPVVEVVRRLKRLQDILGDVNDSHVLLDELRGLEDREKAHRTGVHALERRLRARVDELHDVLAREWSGRGIAELAAAARRLAEGWAGPSGLPREVERKYLLRGLPDLPPTSTSVTIDQGWLPGDTLQERLRREAEEGRERFLRTVKVGRGVERIELEEETTRELFDVAWPLTDGRRVAKRRHRVREGDLTWEVDEFLDRDLFLAEVELPRAELAVTIPPWLAPVVVRDVTGEDAYVNVNLAR